MKFVHLLLGFAAASSQWTCDEVAGLQNCCNSDGIASMYSKHDAHFKNCAWAKSLTCEAAQNELDEFVRDKPATVDKFIDTCGARRLEQTPSLTDTDAQFEQAFSARLAGDGADMDMNFDEALKTKHAIDKQTCVNYQSTMDWNKYPNPVVIEYGPGPQPIVWGEDQEKQPTKFTCSGYKSTDPDARPDGHMIWRPLAPGQTEYTVTSNKHDGVTVVKGKYVGVQGARQTTTFSTRRVQACTCDRCCFDDPMSGLDDNRPQYFNGPTLSSEHRTEDVRLPNGLPATESEVQAYRNERYKFFSRQDPKPAPLREGQYSYWKHRNFDGYYENESGNPVPAFYSTVPTSTNSDYLKGQERGHLYAIRQSACQRCIMDSQPLPGFGVVTISFDVASLSMAIWTPAMELEYKNAMAGIFQVADHSTIRISVGAASSRRRLFGGLHIEVTIQAPDVAKMTAIDGILKLGTFANDLSSGIGVAVADIINPSWGMQVTAPNESQFPTKAPTKTPTKAPTKVPTKAPTKVPTMVPTMAPTKAPTKKPMCPVKCTYDGKIRVEHFVEHDGQGAVIVGTTDNPNDSSEPGYYVNKIFHRCWHRGIDGSKPAKTAQKSLPVDESQWTDMTRSCQCQCAQWETDECETAACPTACGQAASELSGVRDVSCFFGSDALSDNQCLASAKPPTECSTTCPATESCTSNP